MKTKIYQLEKNIKDIARLRKERYSYEEIIQWLAHHMQLQISKVTLLNFCKKHGIKKGLQNDDIQKMYQELIEESEQKEIVGLNLKSPHVTLTHKDESLIFTIQKNSDFFGRSHWNLVPVDAGKKELEDDVNVFFEQGFIPKSLIAGYCIHKEIVLPITPKFYAEANQFYSYDI